MDVWGKETVPAVTLVCRNFVQTLPGGFFQCVCVCVCVQRRDTQHGAQKSAHGKEKQSCKSHQKSIWVRLKMLRTPKPNG